MKRLAWCFVFFEMACAHVIAGETVSFVTEESVSIGTVCPVIAGDNGSRIYYSDGSYVMSVATRRLKEVRRETSVKLTDPEDRIEGIGVLKDNHYVIVSVNLERQIVSAIDKSVVQLDASDPYKITTSASGEIVALSNYRADFVVYDYRGKKFGSFQSPYHSGVFTPRVEFAFGANESLFYLNSTESTLRVLNPNGATVLKSIRLPYFGREMLLGMAIFNKGKAIAVFSDVDIVTYTFPEIEKRLSISLDNSSCCTGVAISPDNKLLVAAFRPVPTLWRMLSISRPKFDIRAYSLATGKKIGSQTLDWMYPVSIMTFDEKSSDLLTISNNEHITRYRLKAK